MGRIGIKIFKAQLIIILIVFITTISFFSFLSKQYLIHSSHEELKKEIIYISDMLENVNLNKENVEKKLMYKKGLKEYGKIFDSDIVILDKSGKVLYNDAKNIDSYFLKTLSQKDNINISGFVSEKEYILDKKGHIKGIIFLMSKLKDLDNMTNLMMKSLWISFIMAGIISSIIGSVLEKSITKPIMKLMNKMSNFSVKTINNVETIKTGDEIENLDKCFTEMGLKIKKYNEEQEKFFQNTSHELKTPLMSIQGYAEAIKDGVIEDDEIEESLDIIIKESQRLKKLVDEIIYITKLENKEDRFEFTKTSLNEILNDSIKSLKPLANSKKLIINLEIEDECIGTFDKEKMLRVFINIIGNSIRYAHSFINIKVIKNDKNIEIVIEDDGIGFKNGEENKIFNRFYKGKNGGTGLGLFIAKLIVNNHNGRIMAYNNTTSGAVFKIVFQNS